MHSSERLGPQKAVGVVIGDFAGSEYLSWLLWVILCERLIGPRVPLKRTI